MKLEVTLTYNQESMLSKEANQNGVDLQTWVQFLLDEHTDQSYDRQKRLEISRINRNRYFN